MNNGGKWAVGLFTLILDGFLIYFAVVDCFIHQRIGMSRGESNWEETELNAIITGLFDLGGAAFITWRAWLMLNDED